MAITGIGNTYNVFESTYAAQKNEAAKEVNANGLGIWGNGMLSHISQMMVQRAENWMNGIGTRMTFSEKLCSLLSWQQSRPCII